MRCLAPATALLVRSLLVGFPLVGFLLAGSSVAGSAVAGSAGAASTAYEDHQDPRVRALWVEGLALEEREELLESIGRYERIAETLPDSAFIRWRLARNYWRYGERLPTSDKRQRLHFFGLANQWADAALAADPDCGECILWKVAALGRISTTRGVLRAAGSASTIAELIERGIELRPMHSDGPNNVTLANLYYAGSAFYRVVPDWWWLKMVIGVRGDRRRALDYIDRAIVITEQRIDYHVERGAVLLCLGTEEKDAQRIEEGRAVLRRAIELENFQSTDSFDREHAHILIEEPARACGYSRDGWIDLSEAAR